MNLQEFFKVNNRVALAFSGGVDSAYLLYAAVHMADQVCAYYVKSEFQPQFELEDAKRLAEELGATMKVINLSVLADEKVRANGPRRCYYCKRQIFESIMDEAAADGFDVIIDGTNASDDPGDRPGVQALRELEVKSPLRQAGLTKADVRRLSKEAGLFTWDKPAYACLATRIATGEEITAEVLQITEKAEDKLASMGFADFRVRESGGIAKIQVKADQMKMLIENREEIVRELRQLYDGVTLDMEAR